jgi:hypothetical protein
MKKITAKIFKAKTGRSPELDDLERVNCDKAGEVGHYSCGWCHDHQKPVFECGCRLRKDLLHTIEEAIEMKNSKIECLREACYQGLKRIEKAGPQMTAADKRVAKVLQDALDATEG